MLLEMFSRWPRNFNQGPAAEMWSVVHFPLTWKKEIKTFWHLWLLPALKLSSAFQRFRFKFYLDENLEIFKIFAVPSSKGFKKLKTSWFGVNYNLNFRWVGNRRLVSVLTGIKPTARQFIAIGRILKKILSTLNYSLRDRDRIILRPFWIHPCRIAKKWVKTLWQLTDIQNVLARSSTCQMNPKEKGMDR